MKGISLNFIKINANYQITATINFHLHTKAKFEFKGLRGGNST